MKFGAIPTNLIERLAWLTGQIPIPALDALTGPLKARAIMAAASLDVFEALREGPQTAADVARQCNLDAAALEQLLRALVVFDYIVQSRAGDGTDRFGLSAMARRTVLRGTPHSLAGYLAFNEVQWRFCAQLETVVRSGRGIDFHATMVDAAEWRAYQLAMLEFARFTAPVLASRVPVPPASRTLLDLAGSHGLMGATICRRHPPLQATVLDLPQAVPHARALAAAEGLTDVVTHVEGNLLTSDLGVNYDVVLLSEILHHFSAETIGGILGRVHEALRPGGVAAIWELEAPRAGDAAGAGDIPALYFRLTSAAGAFHGAAYAEWLRQAGFERVRIARPVLAPGHVLVTARRD